MRFANAACGLFIYLFTILMSATVNKCTERGRRGSSRGGQQKGKQRRAAEVGTSIAVANKQINSKYH